MSNRIDDMFAAHEDEANADYLAHAEGQYFDTYIAHCIENDLDVKEYTFEDWANDQLPEYA